MVLTRLKHVHEQLTALYSEIATCTIKQRTQPGRPLLLRHRELRSQAQDNRCYGIEHEASYLF